MDLRDYAKQIETAQRAARLADRSRPWTPSATPATDLGYRCERRIVYHRTQPLDAQPISEELASIFTEGNLHQTDVRRELAGLGFEVVESELNFRDPDLEITGTIDGKIEVPDEKARHGMRRVPVEIKSSAGNPPKTQEELRMHTGLYGRYYCQIQVYLFLTSSPDGLFLFKDKITGLWSLVPVDLDYEQAEFLLQKAERVRDAIAANSLPERLSDRSECPGCPWADTVCHPEESAPDPMLLAQDDDLANELMERESLDVPRKRYKALDDKVKQRFKLTKGDRFLCGDFTIVKKKHGRGVRVQITRSAEKATEE